MYVSRTIDISPPFAHSAVFSQLSIFARNQLEWRGAIRLTSRQERVFSCVCALRKIINALPGSNALIRKLCGARRRRVNNPSRMWCIMTMSFSIVNHRFRSIVCRYFLSKSFEYVVFNRAVTNVASSSRFLISDSFLYVIYIKIRYVMIRMFRQIFFPWC